MLVTHYIKYVYRRPAEILTRTKGPLKTLYISTRQTSRISTFLACFEIRGRGDLTCPLSAALPTFIALPRSIQDFPTSQSTFVFQPLELSSMGNQSQGYEMDSQGEHKVFNDVEEGQSKPWWGAGREGTTVENTARINV